MPDFPRLKPIALALLLLWLGFQVLNNYRALRRVHATEARLKREIAVLQAKRVLLEYRQSLLQNPESAAVFVWEHRYPGGAP